jgi:glucosamine kinase
VIAVVYSGSRFSDWRLANKGKIITGFKGMGINPNLHNEQHILQSLNKSNTLINYAEQIKKIYFFGAGSSSNDRKDRIQRVFQEFFINAKIYVDQDIVGAAISALGDHKGYIGILGSGSNVGFFNGKRMMEDNYGLGYILADEGSSNWIGRTLLKHFLTETMPDDIYDLFIEAHPIDRKQVLEKVYNNPNPNQFLTSFSDFVSEHKSHPFIYQIIKSGFELFFKTYVLPLQAKYGSYPLSFVGSIAATHEDTLRSVAKDFGCSIDKIIQEPIHNLLLYYINKRT